MARMKVKFDGKEYWFKGNWFTGLKIWLGIENKYKIAEMVAKGQLEPVENL